MEEQKSETQPQATQTTATRIVVYGKHDYILQNTETLLNRANYETTGFLEEWEVEDHIRMNPVDGLLIGGGVEPHDRQKIVEFVKTEFPAIRIIEHFGGPATILPEVNKAFGK